MIVRLKLWLASLRWRRFTRHIDRQIADARRHHRPTRHLLQAKSDFLHDALRGGAR